MHVKLCKIINTYCATLHVLLLLWNLPREINACRSFCKDGTEFASVTMYRDVRKEKKEKKNYIDKRIISKHENVGCEYLFREAPLDKLRPHDHHGALYLLRSNTSMSRLPIFHRALTIPMEKERRVKTLCSFMCLYGFVTPHLN